MNEASDRPADRIVTMQRVFAISRDRLFRAWTDPVELAKWWGPQGWTLDRCEVDVRPEGQWKTWFRLADGSERYIGGVYLEVVPAERLVFTWEPEPEDGVPEAPSVVTLEFEARDNETTLSLTHRKLTTGRAVDMDVGWSSTFDSLEEYAGGLHPIDRSTENGAMS